MIGCERAGNCDVTAHGEQVMSARLLINVSERESVFDVRSRFLVKD